MGTKKDVHSQQRADQASKASQKQERGVFSPTLGALVNPDSESPAKSSAASIADNFTYHGGPILPNAIVYTSYWGNQWQADPGHQNRVSYLNQFMTDLTQSTFMNILTQYGVAGPKGSCFWGTVYFTNVPSTLTLATIQDIIQVGIDTKTLPEPRPPSERIRSVLFIYLDESITVNDPSHDRVLCEPTDDTSFGFHNFFMTNAGHPFCYALLPSLSDACVKATCPPTQKGCSLNLIETQEQRLTVVTSNLFAGMLTDPQFSGWYDPDPYYGENGDICIGRTDSLTVGANIWLVSPTYSKYDDLQSNSAYQCVTQAAEPEPALSGAPVPTSPVKQHTIASTDRLLPLPPLSVDIKTRQAKMVDPQELYLYAQRHFHPWRYERIMPPYIPDLLRQLADILEKK